jgi:hypothetical protein
MVALPVSEACKIGLTPLVNPAHEALTRVRLVHEGPLASVDGLRFQVPVRTINAAP